MRRRKKDPRGGPRPGAGRPRGEPGRTASISARIPTAAKLRFYEAVPSNQRSAKITGWILAEFGPL